MSKPKNPPAVAGTPSTPSKRIGGTQQLSEPIRKPNVKGSDIAYPQYEDDKFQDPNNWDTTPNAKSGKRI